MELPKQMRLTYLQRRQDDLFTLKESLKKNNLEEFQRIGHQLSGNAASFGFEDLVPIALAMEDLNSETLNTEGDRLLNQMALWLQTAQKKLT